MADEEKEKSAGGEPSGRPPVPEAPKGLRNYVVVSPVRHDGDDYSSGETITLSKKDAKDLLKVGAVRERE